MLLTLLYFTIAIFLLTVVHEFGHFIVARYCGVKVLRFSFGFGKVLTRWFDKQGTEYAISLFPLGGYVKMLTEGENVIPAHEQHMTFNCKPVWMRIAIVAAGPLFNFLFAWLALWLVLVLGIQSLAPIVDKVKPDSIAALSGLKSQQEIISFHGTPVASWRDVQYAFMPLFGTKKPIQMEVKSLTDGSTQTLKLSLKHWTLDTKKPDFLASLGITPLIPKIPPIIGEVVESSPAAKAKLHSDDRILTVDGQPISDWLMFVEYVRKRPNQSLIIEVNRQGLNQTMLVQVASKTKSGHKEGFLGLRSKPIQWPARFIRLQQQSPIQAIKTATVQTIELTGATFNLIGQLVLGHMSLQSLSGPVGIAQSASESARGGLTHYLSFLALLSISLGVLNLLPIPLLDGGHLFYFFIEIIRRRPVSEELKSIGTYMGLLLLVMLMIIALQNDLTKLAE